MAGENGGLWGGIAAGIGTLAAGIWDAISTRKTAKENTDKTIAANKAEAEVAYERAKDMVQMQNEYNSPQSQMQRFAAAGLNPHLVYSQGNAGNQSSTPEYRPARLEYNYAAGNYGAAVNSMLPMMMQVGSWMMDMKAKDQALQQGQENLYTTDLKQAQLQQLISYLEKRNPKLLEEMDNKLNLFPYQKDMQIFRVDRAHAELQKFAQEYEHLYGHKMLPNNTYFNQPEQSGMRSEQLLEQRLKNMSQMYRNKLLDAQSSWTDFDITNPQQLMQGVVGGAMSLFGQALRLKPSASGKINQGRLKKKRTRTVGRDKTEFFEYNE